MYRLILLVLLNMAISNVQADVRTNASLNELIDFEQPLDTLWVEPVLHTKVGEGSQYSYLEDVDTEPVIGAHLFNSDGLEVGSFQNIDNLLPSTLLFTQADFFITTPPIGRFSVVDPGQDPLDCGIFIECSRHSEFWELGVDYVGVYGTLSANPVPEPENYALMTAGLGILGLAMRRRKIKPRSPDSNRLRGT